MFKRNRTIQKKVQSVSQYLIYSLAALLPPSSVPEFSLLTELRALLTWVGAPRRVPTHKHPHMRTLKHTHRYTHP